MATKEHTAPAEARPAIEDAGAARLFARRFPQLQLTFFERFLYPKTTHDHCVLSFEGPIDRLLALGMVRADMIAARPKRVLWGRGESAAGHRSEFWWTKRLRGEGLSVRRELFDDVECGALSCLAPGGWPYDETAAERRERARRELLETATAATSVVNNVGRRFAVEFAGLRLALADAERIRAMSAAFSEQLLSAVRGARLDEPTTPLRLVVDNSRQETPA